MSTNTVQQTLNFENIRHYPALLLGLVILPQSDLLEIQTFKFKDFLPGERRFCFVQSRVL